MIVGSRNTMYLIIGGTFDTRMSGHINTTLRNDYANNKNTSFHYTYSNA